MSEVKNEAATLVIASPPFTNNPDGRTLDKSEYLCFIRKVFSEIVRVLMPGGVLITVNTDLRDHARYNQGLTRFDGSLWQKHCDIRVIAESLGFRCIETKIWVKTLNRNEYRYTFAYIQFFQKPRRGSRRSLLKNQQKDFATDVWLLERGTNRRDSQGYLFRDAIHPEIVKRCLEQFTSLGDLVISPFTGSGTILAVANLMGRRSIGFEINRRLKKLIRESIETPDRFPAYLGCTQSRLQ